MKKIMLWMCFMAALPVMAQETYQDANTATEDLNGTARYVGMGGAMEALGADISTISTNPAGIGLFRRSNVSATIGVVSQGNVDKAATGDKTHMSFDQIGFVYSRPSGKNSYINFGFNYHKSRDFNHILYAANKLGDGSQQILSYASGISTGQLGYQGTPGKYEPTFTGAYPPTYSQVDELINQGLNFNTYDGEYYYLYADDYVFNRHAKGYIGEYDFNLSGNINDRVYLGITFGLHDVHYKGFTNYEENLTNDIESLGDAELYDERKITGIGYDVKAGVIVRPIEESAFRLGAYVSTPTFYDLKTSNYTQLDNYLKEYMIDGKPYSAGAYSVVSNEDVYEFRLNTPWKFGLSAGHTVGNFLALGATFEYSDFSGIDTREKGDEYYDAWYDTYYTSSYSDNAMNDHTDATLKGVCTVKVGAEYKPIPELALRAGYNYVSPAYKKDGMRGYRDGFIQSLGTAYSSTTDYTNWDCTHRITLGLGYTFKNFYADLAYQYSTKKGDFYPFQKEFSMGGVESFCSSTKVEDNRHQAMLTLGYRF